MKLSSIKRIVKEEFEKDYQDLIDRLSFLINPVFEQLKAIMDKGITLADNINCDIKDISVTVDANGIPLPALQVPIRARSLGLVVMRATPANSVILPTGAVYVQYDDAEGTIAIRKVTGLQPNTRYTLRLVIFYG